MQQIITLYALDAHEKKQLAAEYAEQLTKEFAASEAAQKLKEQIMQQTEQEIIRKMDELAQKSESQLKLITDPYRYTDVRLARLLRQFAAQLVQRTKHVSDAGIETLENRLSPYRTDKFQFNGILDPLLQGLPEKQAPAPAPEPVPVPVMPAPAVTPKPVHTAAGVKMRAGAAKPVSKDFTMMSALAERNGRSLALNVSDSKGPAAMIVQRDGTVFSVNAPSALQKPLRGLTNVKEIAACTNSVAVLHYDGKPEAFGAALLHKKCASWPAMQGIRFSEQYLHGISTAGKMYSTHPTRLPVLRPSQVPVSLQSILNGYLILLRDGSVIGEYKYGCGEWTNIISIAAGTNHFLGLTREGQVLAVDITGNRQALTQTWKNVIAIAAYGNYSVGLTSDGTLLTTDPELSAQVSGWHEIAGFTLRNHWVLAVTNSGKVLSNCIQASVFAGCKPNFVTIPR
ncbi:MAG: hypothetical protein IJ060_12980 [Oscillospiraceae bacterium]|nr:hypothetical protein [Oscillospiraceae bacterium]